MEKTAALKETQASLKTLPGDDVRQIMWRFADRYDYQMVIQSVRSVARGPVARAVAQGSRNSHEWTKEKADLLKEYDAAGISAAPVDPKYGGYLEGPKNLILSLMAYELSWVDAGAATSSMANTLALAPIHERGTEEQKKTYMSGSVPPQPGEKRKILRGAFALTEPIPYIGVDTGVVSGKLRVAEWKPGQEPILQVEKRGRFITNIGFCNFVTATVDSDDERIKGSCVVILEDTDPGVFDRGTATKKLAHQLSSTGDPVFNLKIPAHRIIGGYTIKDGVIVPNYNHSEVLESVFARTRVSPAIMTSAKLISAVEPVIRYQRTRYRGGSSSTPGTPRYELGLQQKEDAVQRLVDVWAAGEAGASLGFETARLLDQYDPLEKEKDREFAAAGIKGGRAQLKAFRSLEKSVIEYLELSVKKNLSAEEKKRLAELGKDTIVKYMVNESLTFVMIPACKLWNTGHGVNMMREAVSLMGGYGITEDCPGFLPYKWIDGQLEATYEGPEVVQRRQLSITLAREIFRVQFRQWIKDMRHIASKHPAVGAGVLASAMELWLWSLEYLLKAKDADGRDLYQGHRHGVSYPMADAFCWIAASRSLIMDTLELIEKGPANPTLAEGLSGFVSFFSDLSHVHAASAAGEASRICAEQVYGYKTGTHELEEEFTCLRQKVDASLIGSKLAKDRAGEAVAQVMIPEALDYPL